MSNFEKLLKSVIGENIPQPTQPTSPVTPSSTSQQDDEQLMNLIKQKLQDAKFKEALMKAINDQKPTGTTTASTQQTTSVPVTNTPAV